MKKRFCLPLLGSFLVAAPILGQTAEPPTSELLLFLRPGAVTQSIAADYQLIASSALAGSTDIVVFSASSVTEALRLQPLLQNDSRISQAFIRYQTRDVSHFTANDPFFFPGSNPPVGGPGNTGSTSFPGQWHLVNQMPASGSNNISIHANVQPVWTRNITGAGVVVGVVDDAVQVLHPDLAPNNVAALSRNFVDNNSDPAPLAAGASHHGTSVAGVAVGRGNNSIGGTGAAPLAGLAGMRTELGGTQIENAISWNNGTIAIKNHSYGAGSAYSARTTHEALLVTSAGNGTINVYSAGNGRGSSIQDSNTLDRQNSPHTIVVAAIGSAGTFASYSSFGASVTVTGPSSGNGFSITTTDRTGSVGYNTNGTGNFADLNYTNNFGGTSSSAPLVSGVLALMREVRTSLDATPGHDAQDFNRYTKHLLARTSVLVHAADASVSSDGGWRTNAAGFRFNQNYGFGMIDADALTLAAATYNGVSLLTRELVGTTNVNTLIPDNNIAGITQTFTINSTTSLEEVLVTLNIAHSRRGDLTAFLTSPSGYTSRLFINNADTGDNINWEFMTNAFWGENPFGTWSLNVRDVTAGSDTGAAGQWNSFAATFRMGFVTVPEPGTIALMGLGIAGVGYAAYRYKRKRNSLLQADVAMDETNEA